MLIKNRLIVIVIIAVVMLSDICLLHSRFEYIDYSSLERITPLDIPRQNVCSGQIKQTYLPLDATQDNLIVSYKPTVQIGKDGKSTDLWIQNSKHNKLHIQVHIKNKKTGNSIYVSPVLKPNEYVSNIRLDEVMSDIDDSYELYTYTYKYIDEKETILNMSFLQISEVMFING